MTETAPGYTAGRVRAAERLLLERGEPLMDRAAAALADVIRRSEASGPLLVLAGGGDNGGDALLAAAELAADGSAVDIAAVGAHLHPRGADAARAAGARIVDLDSALERAAAGGYGLIVDGMVGIGARGPLRDDARRAARALAFGGGGGARIVAVDIPSGLDPDTGEAEKDAAVVADVTVTFGAAKAGLGRGCGAALSGLVVLVDLGLDLTVEGESDGADTGPDETVVVTVARYRA